MAAAPIQIEVWSKAFQRLGYVGSPLSLSATKRRNAASDCTFTIPADHPRVADLMTSGARCVVTYRFDDAQPPMRIISGRVQTRSGEGQDRAATRTFDLRDDWTILNTTTAWPNPAKPIDQQADQAYYKVAGPAETAVLDLLAKNYVTRLGQALTVPATQGRGAAVSLQLRMDYLADKLFPAVDAAGIIVDIGQVAGHREVTIRTPATYPRKLTEGSGVVVNGSFSADEVTATRVIVGLGGSDVGRLFRQFTNTTAETAIGEPLEVFIDASDVALTDDLTAESQTRATDTFTDNAAKVDLSVELIETGAFRFGTTFQVGDVVTVQLAGGTEFTDYVRDVELSYATGDGGGLKVVPHVGNWDGSSDSVLINEIVRMGKALRALQRR